VAAAGGFAALRLHRNSEAAQSVRPFFLVFRRKIRLFAYRFLTAPPLFSYK